MLRIFIPPFDGFDETTNEFIKTVEFELKLEHSLVSLSKWESIYETPFLGKEKTAEQTYAYIRCMTLPEEEIPEVYHRLTSENLEEINTYIHQKQTATWFKENPNQSRSREIITAERIYYWMIAYGIPFDPCQNWHLSRLLTLIKVANEEQKPKQKVNTRQLAARNRALNEQRMAQYKTRG
jgi:hypothetical protein